MSIFMNSTSVNTFIFGFDKAKIFSDDKGYSFVGLALFTTHSFGNKMYDRSRVFSSDNSWSHC